MPFIESLDEFTMRQNCKYVNTDRQRLYENGARAIATGFTQQPYRLYDPPTDELNLLRAKLEYKRTKYENEAFKYNQALERATMNASMAERYSNLPRLSQETVEMFEKASEEIRKLRDEVTQMEEELTWKTKPLEAHSFDKQLRQEHSDRASKLRTLPTFPVASKKQGDEPF